MKGQKVTAGKVGNKNWKGEIGTEKEQKIVLGGNVVDRWLKKKTNKENVGGRRRALI